MRRRPRCTLGGYAALLRSRWTGAAAAGVVAAVKASWGSRHLGRRRAHLVGGGRDARGAGGGGTRPSMFQSRTFWSYSSASAGMPPIQRALERAARAARLGASLGASADGVGRRAGQPAAACLKPAQPDGALARSTSQSAGPHTSDLRLMSGAWSIPHPGKANSKGSDSYFHSREGNSVGVADGVGGWRDYGVDPGLFS